MAEFRKVLADGDLVVQKKAVLGGFFCRKTAWNPFRNLSREVRFLEQRMHDAHAMYKSAQEDFVVAQKNVHLDSDLLRMHKMDNSEVAYVVPSDESILDRRDGVKYNQGSPNQKQKGQGGGNGNNQQNNNSGGGDNNQNQQGNNKQKGGNQRTIGLRELLSAKIVLH